MQLNLKTKITALMLLLFICSIWTLTYIVSARLEREMIANEEKEQFAIASYIAENIESQVNLRIRALRLIANEITPELISNPRELQEFLRKKTLLLMLFQTGCVVISIEGRGIADYPVLPGRKGSSFSELEYFKDVVDAGRPAVGKPRIGRFSKKPVVGFAVPVLSPSGRLMAVFVGYTLTSDPTLLGSIENSDYKNFPDRLLIASPKYRIFVAASDSTRVLTPTPEPGVNPLFDRFMSGYEGSGIAVNARGIKILLSAKQIPSPGWIMRVGLPTEIAFAPIRSMKMWSFSIALVLSLISSLLVWLIIRKTLDPLYVASKQIKEMTDGQMPMRVIPVARHDEIGQLLDNFNKHLLQRKRVEDELRAHEKLLKDAQRITMTGNWELDHMNNKLTWSDEIYRIFELDREHFGASYEAFLEAIHPEDRDVVNYAFANSLKTREPYEITHRLLMPDGRIKYVLEQCETSYSPDGTPLRSLGIVRDITERENAEEALRESEVKFKTLFNNASDAIFTMSHTTFLDCNATTEKVFRCTREQIIGHSPVAFSPERQPDGRLSSQSAMERIMAAFEGQPQHFEWLHTRFDGAPFYAEVSLNRVYIEGKYILQAIVRDISERKRAQDEKEKLEHQLRQAQKMESIGTLAGGIAHDFNNILTAIIGYGNITLMTMPNDDPHRLDIEQMIAAAERAAHLTKDLLLFSRKQASERTPVSMNYTIQKIEKFLKRVIGEDIECRTQLGSGALPVMGDGHQLEQVLMNLATIARDAMPKGGTFTIATEQVQLDKEFITAHGYGSPGSYVLTTVSDTGSGMDAATRDHIFEPFYTTKEVGKGTGLGLAVVYGIIKQHEGFIAVYSEPGRGTTFNIYLPLDEAQVGENRIVQEEKPARGTETILLAEDDEIVRNMTRTVLQRFGYTVIVATDGQHAVEKYIENKDTISLLLFDLIMPKKTGVEAWDEIKAIKPDVKVLFQSGYAPDMIREKLVLDDKIPIINKPVAPKVLLKKVREMLDQAK